MKLLIVFPRPIVWCCQPFHKFVFIVPIVLCCPLSCMLACLFTQCSVFVDSPKVHSSSSFDARTWSAKWATARMGVYCRPSLHFCCWPVSKIRMVNIFSLDYDHLRENGCKLCFELNPQKHSIIHGGGWNLILLRKKILFIFSCFQYLHML